jgi:hypothetical protein
MKKPDFDDDKMTPEAWEALIKKGMDKVKRQYAAKNVPMHHIVNGQIIAIPKVTIFRRVDEVKAVSTQTSKTVVKVVASKITH